MTIKEALATAAQRIHSDEARLDAELLLMHVLGCSRAHLYAWPERPLETQAAATFEALVTRRSQGEPVAYLTGRREFWSMELEVGPATLIPRPETELLVELALARIPADARWSLADLGTGSGAIALALAKERPGCTVVATDRSAAALDIAAANARSHGLSNIEFRAGAWFEPLANRDFQLIVSNPPYIHAEDPHLTRGDLRFEPLGALVADGDGLGDLRHLVAGASHHLTRDGWLLLEHGFDQGHTVRSLMETAGLGAVQTVTDLEGRDRVTLGRRADRDPGR